MCGLDADALAKRLQRLPLDRRAAVILVAAPVFAKPRFANRLRLLARMQPLSPKPYKLHLNSKGSCLLTLKSQSWPALRCIIARTRAALPHFMQRACAGLHTARRSVRSSARDAHAGARAARVLACAG